MKHAHTAGPFEANRQGMAASAWWDIRTTAKVNPFREQIATVTGVLGHDDQSEANAELLALAPTAPHDCDIPGCPGAENKRKLEAAEELLARFRTWVAAVEASGIEGTDSFVSAGHVALRIARETIAKAKAQDAKVGGAK